MAKKIFNKRVIAMALTLVMLFNGFQISASAAQNDTTDLVQNPGDTYYKQDGTAGTASDWEIHLSKTAAPTAQDNIYNITLKVETKDTFTQLAGTTDGAAVLVLDVSNSMDTAEGGCTYEGCTSRENAAVHCMNYEREYFWRDSCENCDKTEAQHADHHKYSVKTQLDSLKEAVAGFLDTFAEGAQAGEKRLVSVVVFGTGAETIQTWVDVNNATALQNLKSKINSLSTGNGAYLGNSYLFNGGTNMEGGLVLGRNLLKQDAVAAIPVANQSLILFSDGAPTARVSDVNSTATDEIGYGGSDTGSRTDSADYDDIAAILSDVSAAKIAVAYNYNDNLGILNAPPFTRVINSGSDSLSIDLQGEAGKVITNKTNASTVTDPMGTGVTMVTVTSGYSAATKHWDLSKFTPSVADGITTYTITYQVEIDPEAVEADAANPAYTILTPANGETTLNYTYGENATSVKADFNEPSIRGVRSFTVRYEYAGEVPAGAPEVPVDATYKAGQSVQVAAAPALENYTFSGWNKSDFVMPASDVTIVGSWTENAKYDYSLTYDANFGDNETKADAENISGIYATTHNVTVDKNTFARDNYTFIGWNTQRDGSGKAYAANDVVTLNAANNTAVLYAQWLENDKFNYSVIYNANFGDNETKADTENVTGTYATSLNVTVDANTFVRDNYTFIGWNTKADGTGMAYAAGDIVALTAQNNTAVLYAQWVENDKFNYSVIYNANFGDNETKADIENVTNTYAVEYTIGVDENTFNRPNYTFLGWATAPNGEVVYMSGDEIHFVEGGQEVLYAQWEEHPKYNYTVIYNGNGGALVDSQLAYGDSENVENTYATALNIKVDANTFVRANYTFIGWNTAADGTGTTYAVNDVIALTAENNAVTLYAQWAENPKYDYSVVYNANFGDNETKTDAENVTGTYATTLNMGVDANGFVRRGYTFIGWNTAADGTGTAYAANDVIALTAQNNTATLYAQWQINEYDYTVNYWVRINGEAYALFAGDLSSAPTGEKVAFGTVIDKAYLDAKGLPATLTDAEFVYNFNAFEGITVAEEGNVVNVYFTCIVEEPPVVEPPVVEPPVVEPPVVEPPIVEPPVVEPPVTEPEVTEPEVTEPEAEEEIEIPEEDVPLADLPKTGDPIFVYIGSTVASAAGLVCLMFGKKKTEEEA